MPESKNTTTVPDWLEAELFEELLQKEFPNYMGITDFQVRPALGPGENYATIMLRVEIEVELTDKLDRITYVVKVPIANELFCEIQKERNLFECETKIYKNVIPELEQMYRNVGLEITFGPQYYALPIKRDFVLLEDLKRYAFKNCNRIEGLDLEHTQAVLKKLAQWHAATATRVATKGEYEPMLADSFFSESQRPFVKQMVESAVPSFLASIERKPGDEKCFENLENVCNNLTEEIFKIAEPNHNEFNVLNHGDCWSNNIMFQYDGNGKIHQTYLVDYQATKFGSPAQDLLYFLISSLRLELKIKRFDYFVKYYYDYLVDYLRLLGYPKELPTLKQFHIMLIQYSIWATWCVMGVMAAVNNEQTEDANLDNYLSDSADGWKFKMQLYSNNTFRKHLDIVLPWLYQRGALERT